MSIIKKYKFSDKNHSPGGIVSTVMGLTALVLLIVAIYKATKLSGTAGTEIGTLGFISAVLALVGSVVGLLSFREKEKYYLFSKLGSIMCGLLTVFMLAVFLMGFGL